MRRLLKPCMWRRCLEGVKGGGGLLLLVVKKAQSLFRMWTVIPPRNRALQVIHPACHSIWMTSIRIYMLIPICAQLIMCTEIPICKLFSDPHPFTYGDPHMHTAIPVCKNTHTGIQDLISNMEILNISCMHTVSYWNIPVCIRGSCKSLYAYGDC
jgi:hypothetical protein